jgi:myosin-crossreactive antigen
LKNFAFISQFVAIADDCVFTVEYSFEALIKAFK